MTDKYSKLDATVEQMKRARQQEYEKHKQINQREYERQMAMNTYPGGYPGSQGNNPLYPSTNQAHTHTINYPSSVNVPLRQATVVYSLAEVQLTGGRMIGMTISAAPTLGKHLTETMKSTGFLHMFNESESLMIRSEEVVAIKLTKLTTE